MCIDMLENRVTLTPSMPRERPEYSRAELFGSDQNPQLGFVEIIAMDFLSCRTVHTTFKPYRRLLPDVVSGELLPTGQLESAASHR